jgi:hypothetical protein
MESATTMAIWFRAEPIQIVVAGPNEVNLTALCRTVQGSSNHTSIPLDNISNNNGNLTQ